MKFLYFRQSIWAFEVDAIELQQHSVLCRRRFDQKFLSLIENTLKRFSFAGNFVTLTAEFDASSEYLNITWRLKSHYVGLVIPFLAAMSTLERSAILILSNLFFNCSRFTADSPYSTNLMKHEAFWIVDNIAQSGEIKSDHDSSYLNWRSCFQRFFFQVHAKAQSTVPDRLHPDFWNLHRRFSFPTPCQSSTVNCTSGRRMFMATLSCVTKSQLVFIDRVTSTDAINVFCDCFELSYPINTPMNCKALSESFGHLFDYAFS